MSDMHALPGPGVAEFLVLGSEPEAAGWRWNLDAIVTDLRSARLEWRKRRLKQEHGSRVLPSRSS